MQALSIYLLVRLDEGQTEDNNVDYLLTTTVIVSFSPLLPLSLSLSLSKFNPNCVQVISKYLASAQTANEPRFPLGQINDLESAWKTWVVEESKRRCGVFFFSPLLLAFG